MVNGRKKGNRVQRTLIEYFERLGYLVSKVEQGNIYSKERDAFGLFDLICINNRRLVLVQVTTNTPHIHTLFEAFSVAHNINNVHIEQWVWFDRRGWKLFRYKDGVKKVFDYRKEKLNRKEQSEKTLIVGGEEPWGY